MKRASSGRIKGAWYLTGQNGAAARARSGRVWDRDCANQSLCVRMLRALVYDVGIREFNDPPQVHDSDAVRNVANRGKVMRNKEVGEVELLLKILHQVHNLGLNRDIQRTDGLVADNEFGPQS